MNTPVVDLDRTRRRRKAWAGLREAATVCNPERVAGYLRVLEQETETMPPDDFKAIRIPNTLIDRAEELLPHVKGLDELAILGSRVTVSTVIRMALVRGLAQLKDEVGENGDG